MEEITEEANYYSMLDDDHVFSQTGQNHQQTNKIDASKWKDVECDDVKMHTNKVQSELFDHLDKEILTVRKIVEEKQESMSSTHLDTLVRFVLMKLILHSNISYRGIFHFFLITIILQKLLERVFIRQIFVFYFKCFL